MESKKYGFLTFEADAEPRRRPDGKNEYRWRMLCDCGSSTEVSRSAVTRGLTKSCGCLRSKVLRELCAKKWRKCAAPGCDSRGRSLGYCPMHYQRMKKAGTPDAVRKLKDGYRCLTVDGKIRLVHVLMAERAIGKQLPPGTEVHHVNSVRSDNRPENLVVCQNKAYHKLLHTRTAAMDATGNPNLRKCWICQQWEEPAVLFVGRRVYHRGCNAKAEAVRKAGQS